MHCFLHYSNHEFEPHPSIASAVRDYTRQAEELDRYGQKIEATIHIADTLDEVHEYPDYVLSMGPRGGIRKERA